MKKQKRKQLSIERRDFWDRKTDRYNIGHLSVSKLKYMLTHHSKKDIKLKKVVRDIFIMKGIVEKSNNE